MDYPKVLGASIKIMPTKKRSLEWFEQQPDPIRRQFWHTLAKFGDFLAAEYLRNNSVAIAPLAPAPREISKDYGAKIAKAFSKPLTSSGTVIGQLWPTGVNILLPIPLLQLQELRNQLGLYRGGDDLQGRSHDLSKL